MPTDLLQRGGKADVIESDEVGEQMQLALTMLRRDLDARHDLQRRTERGLPGCGHAAERIVIGDGQGGQTGTAGEIDHLGRRVRAVAVRRVDVQIGAPGVRAAGSKLTKCRERLTGRHAHAGGEGGWRRRSRTPLTNAGESAEP